MPRRRPHISQELVESVMRATKAAGINARFEIDDSKINIIPLDATESLERNPFEVEAERLRQNKGAS
jgi:hypothetical protein